MKPQRRFVLILVGAALALALVLLVWRPWQLYWARDEAKMLLATAVSALSHPQENPTSAAARVPLALQIIDTTTAGDVKLVGDIDGDDLPDLIVGGGPGEDLNWYRYPDWQKTTIAAPNVEFTTDGALGDVDGDGDLDIVVPDGDGGDNLVWFANPLPEGDPRDGAQWQRRTVGAIGSWGKDVELSDFDGSGTLDVATRSQGEAMIFFQTSPNQWQKTPLQNVALGNEGMASGDVDGDGRTDLILHGVWVRNPGGAAARNGSWTQYAIGQADSDFKALVADLNQDGQMDVLFSSSENTADVAWWTPAGGDPTGPWVSHTILPNMERTHTLQAADMDLDGDMDVVLAQMHTSAAAEIMIMLNADGLDETWQKQLVDTGGLHNGVVADIGSDGDYDIFGANWTGNPPVRLWENKLDAAGPLDRWSYKQATDQHAQTFGLGFGDVNGDGRTDIVSGRFWYANPGDDLLVGDWVQSPFPEGMHAFLVVDVDGDALADVIAQKDEDDISLYWLEARDLPAGDWDAVRIGSVEAASHDLGAQGYRAAQIEAGGRPEILISSGNGIYYFGIPDAPTAGDWPRVHISSNPSDEGLATGDIDGDGQTDIAATTGDSKRVEWYRNPGDGSAEWQAFAIATFDDAVFPDRTEIADINGDGRLDIIVTEENGEPSDAQTYWWEQPADPTAGGWTSHLITTQGSTNSLDVADMDANGTSDVVLAEHRGTLKLAIWANDGSGGLTEHVVDLGKESHLGARTADLDGDGDLDIVSIAWDDFGKLHVWRNEGRGHATFAPVTLGTVTAVDDVPTVAQPAPQPTVAVAQPAVPQTIEETANTNPAPAQTAPAASSSAQRVPTGVLLLVGAALLAVALTAYWLLRRTRGGNLAQ